jgi:hypothetical protein
MELSLVWWNTSLSPTARPDRSSAETQDVAYGLAARFIDELGADIIALGEVSADNVSQLSNMASFEGHAVHDGVTRVGRSRFDLCVLFRRSKLTLIGSTELVVRRGSTALKLGQRLDFAVTGVERPIHVLVSHWPSRLWVKSEDPARHFLGIRLRDEVEKIRADPTSGQIILAGDYNDEPFDLSLSDQLMATRDRNLAARRPDLLYNPFWRNLSHTDGGAAPSPGQTYAGSYFHRAGTLTQWRTFDQIIVSSDFLGTGIWSLLERRTRVVDFPEFTSLVLDREEWFDHLPVIAVFERNDRE